MRRFKAKAFLASTAIALLAIALPASASALEWTENGAPIGEGVGFMNVNGWMERTHVLGKEQIAAKACEFSAEIYLYGGAEGELADFHLVDPKNCYSYGGWVGFDSCTITGMTLSGNPVYVSIGGTPSEPTIVLNDISWAWKTYNCEPGNWFYTYEGDLELVPDNPEEISTVTFQAVPPCCGQEAQAWWPYRWRSYAGISGPPKVSPAAVYGIG